MEKLIIGKFIKEFEAEGIYEEPDPKKWYIMYGPGMTKLIKCCILSKKYPQFLDEIKNKFVKEDLDKIDSYGWTPLMFTSYYGLVEATKILIELGANLDFHNNNDITALMFACGRGHEEIVKLLVLARANIHITNCNGENDTIKEILEQGPIMAKSAII